MSSISLDNAIAAAAGRLVSGVQVRASKRVRVGTPGLWLEREPPVAWEQHLDPGVRVIALDQVAAVLLPGSGPEPNRYPCRQPECRTRTAMALV
jgi:hypothetical protein